jgi:hypothetical protein
MTPHSREANRLRVIRKQRPSCERAQGMPGASAAPAASRGNKENHTKVVTTGSPDDSGIPRANGFNGFLRALPGEPGLLSPSPARSSSHTLDISVGISGPHDFAVRFQVARLAHPKRPPHPVPNVRDDRETPLSWARDAVESAGDLGRRSTARSCDRLARRANQVRERKCCQVTSNCYALACPGRGAARSAAPQSRDLC